MASPAPISQGSNHSEDVIVGVPPVSVDPGQYAIDLQAGQRMLNPNPVATQAAILRFLLGGEWMPAAGAMRLVEQLIRPVFLDALIAAIEHGAAQYAVQRGAQPQQGEIVDGAWHRLAHLANMPIRGNGDLGLEHVRSLLARVVGALCRSLIFWRRPPGVFGTLDPLFGGIDDGL